MDNLKNEAGESLVEVKRKQYETDERITVFQLLKDLRDLRKETSIYKGSKVYINSLNKKSKCRLTTKAKSLF